MLLDTLLLCPPEQAVERAAALADCGVDGLFTFEGPHDVFLPLAAASPTGVHLATNVAIAFPRSPIHLAHLGWDLQRMSGGQFALGLGTQVRAHIERRYGSTWSAPVDRMGEWIGAVRAIWTSWQERTPLDFRGEFTTHTLMGPAFDPGPLEWGPPPIWLGALGPRMTELAATVADGLLVHPFSSTRHLQEVTLPRVASALEVADRPREDLTVVGQAIISCASDPEALAASDAAARWLVGFYGSTPAYRPVLETEGRADLHPDLRAWSRTGDWDAMAGAIDDELLSAIVLRGTPDEVAAALVRRFGTDVDRVAFYAPGGISDEDLRALVAAIRSTEA